MAASEKKKKKTLFIILNLTGQSEPWRTEKICHFVLGEKTLRENFEST